MIPAAEFTIKNLSPVFLVVELEQAIQFYHRLGFETEFVYEGFYAALRKDGYSIHLKAGRQEKGRATAEHVDLVFFVSGVRELFEVIKGMGVRVVQPLRQMPYGQEFYIADPDEHVIAMVE